MNSWLWYWLLGGLVLYFLFFCWRWPALFTKRHTTGSRSSRMDLVLVLRDLEDVIEGIIRQLGQVAPALAEGELDVMLVVVDDASRDQTPLIIERLTRCHPQLRFVHLEPGATRSESPVELGLSLSSGPLALVLDLRGRSDTVQLVDDASMVLSGLGSPLDSGSRPRGGRAH